MIEPVVTKSEAIFRIHLCQEAYTKLDLFGMIKALNIPDEIVNSTSFAELPDVLNVRLFDLIRIVQDDVIPS